MSKYILSLASDGRVLSAAPGWYNPGGVQAEMLPEGDISDYRYLNGGFVADPLPDTLPPATPQERLEAQMIYTAMMTDTLLPSENEN